MVIGVIHEQHLMVFVSLVVNVKTVLSIALVVKDVTLKRHCEAMIRQSLTQLRFS